MDIDMNMASPISISEYIDGIIADEAMEYDLQNPDEFEDIICDLFCDKKIGLSSGDTSDHPLTICYDCEERFLEFLARYETEGNWDFIEDPVVRANSIYRHECVVTDVDCVECGIPLAKWMVLEDAHPLNDIYLFEIAAQCHCVSCG